MNILKNKAFILLLFLLLGLILLHISQKKNQQNVLSRISFFFFSEIQTAGINFHRACSETVRKYLFLLELREKNERLKNQNTELQAQQKTLEESLAENERLKKLLDFSINKTMKLQPAQIVGTDWLSKNELLIINKGRQQGIEKFMGVISPQGVVGYIFRVSPNSSQVITLLNPLSSLPARHKNSRRAGLISPFKKNLLLFEILDQDSASNLHFKKGDQIITIESDQFPGGFPAGTVVSWEVPKANTNLKIHIKPSVSFYSLEEVLVVLNPNEKKSLKIENKEINKTKTKKQQ